jgi:hypothetical protein
MMSLPMIHHTPDDAIACNDVITLAVAKIKK